MRTLLTVVMIAGAAGLVGAQGRPAEQLKKAVVQEETGQNPEKAIEAYRAIVAQYRRGPESGGDGALPARRDLPQGRHAH